MEKQPSEEIKDCVNCKFNVEEDDEQVRCELLKMLGKPPEPGCEKYESK